MNKYPITNYTKFHEKIYFLRIARKIIETGDLIKTQKTILDFGCGNKIFSQLLPGKKIYNYDINPDLSEIGHWEKIKFDIVIINHVLMYLNKKQINNLFKKFKKIKPKTTFLIGIGTQNILSKIGTFCINKSAHRNTKINFFDQINIIKKKLLIHEECNVFFSMTKIYYCSFI